MSNVYLRFSGSTRAQVEQERHWMCRWV